MKRFALADVVVRSTRTWALGTWRLERRGRIEVDENHVFLEGVVLAPRARIRDGYLGYAHGQSVVYLLAGIGSVDVTTTTEDDARRLLAALGFDRTQRSARLKLHLGTASDAPMRVGIAFLFATSSGVAMAIGFLMHAPSMSVLVLAGALLLCGVAAFMAVIRAVVSVTIGDDGILLSRWLARPRFLRYAEIDGVGLHGTSMTIRLKHGEPFRLQGPSMEGRMQAAASQIEEAKRTSEKSTSASAGLVARNGRDPSAWMRGLAALDDAAAGYRAAALAPEVLWRIVDDAGASASARAGAAVALRARIDDEGRRRLRVASETCAAPNLRVAFAAAADGLDEAVEQALALVEDETAPIATRALGARGGRS